MYKQDSSENVGNSNKQFSSKSRLRQTKEISIEDNRSRQFKQNDSKHLNAIRPYVARQRKNSKKQTKPAGSSSQISKSKNKRSDSSNRKAQQTSMISCENVCLTNSSQGSKQINQIYQEMMTLKTQYKTLKNSYNNLAKEKQQATSRQQTQKQFYLRQRSVFVEQLEKSKKTNAFLESQIQRIKRECFKIVESEKFKYKKLEQTLQEKELMISYLRKQIQGLRRKDLNSSQQDNLQKVFFLQNSAPIFSYESYARLSANTSTISGIGNVLIEEQSPPSGPKQNKVSIKHKRSQFQEDSLSFSRQRSQQYDSVHSLLTNNDQTILTFTKKDIVVLDESLSIDDQKRKSSQSQNDICLTFENRKQQAKQIIGQQNLKSKKILSKSQSRVQSKKSKSRQQTKRLQILTDDFKDYQKHKQSDDNSCQTKKKFSKSKTRNFKKNSKSQSTNIIGQVLHGSFIKKDYHTSQSKNQLSRRK